MATNATNIADVDLIASLLRCYGRTILETLLVDRTTENNIIWADREYEQLGVGYDPYDEVTPEKICDRWTDCTDVFHPNGMSPSQQSLKPSRCETDANELSFEMPLDNDSDQN